MKAVVQQTGTIAPIQTRGEDAMAQLTPNPYAGHPGDRDKRRAKAWQDGYDGKEWAPPKERAGRALVFLAFEQGQAARVHDDAQPKRIGRPPGSGLPPEQRRSKLIQIRATEDELTRFNELGGADRFREWLRRAK